MSSAAVALGKLGVAPGTGSAGGVQERGREARGLRGEAEERFGDFFLCFLDLPDFDDDDFDKCPWGRLRNRPQDHPRDLDQDQE